MTRAAALDRRPIHHRLAAAFLFDSVAHMRKVRRTAR
jgi:hypothetical protein